MTKQNWRENLDNLTNSNLDELLKETKKYDFAISKAKDKSKAQMWVAMAILNSKLNQILLQKNSTPKKLENNEVEDIIKKLENY